MTDSPRPGVLQLSITNAMSNTIQNKLQRHKATTTAMSHLLPTHPAPLHPLGHIGRLLHPVVAPLDAPHPDCGIVGSGGYLLQVAGTPGDGGDLPLVAV